MFFKAVVATVLLMLSACANEYPVSQANSKPTKPTYSKGCECTPAIQERLQSRLRAFGIAPTAAATNVVTCSFGDRTGCTNDAVVMFDASTQRCVAVPQYCVLCVDTRNRQNPGEHFRPTLRWNLVDKAGGPHSKKFVFDDTLGIDIPASTSGGKKHFEYPQIDPRDKTIFYWSTGKDESGPLNHFANIKPSGSSDAKCGPYDPVIVNTGN